MALTFLSLNNAYMNADDRIFIDFFAGQEERHTVERIGWAELIV
ncbi:hypothetical protein [Sphingomonas gellani]|nr:hypothetical protein [Sphingomonas gellani]